MPAARQEVARPPRPSSSSGLEAPAWPVGQVGLAVAVLVWLLAPSVAWFDAGELAASASVLGVAHPTGFPLFHLGSHPWISLPLGPLALRMHLAGALAAVTGCALWWRTLAGREAHPVTWLGALLLPLLAPSVALHVRGAEVYAWVWLHAGLLAITVARTTGPRRTAAVWALGGVGALIHAESAGLAACVAAWVTAVAPAKERLRPALLGAGLALVAAAGIAYLPVAAGRLPALSWGDVRSVDALWAHLSAASIRRAFVHRFGAGVGAAWQMLVGQLWREIGVIGLAAVPGWALIFRRNRAAAWMTLSLIGLDATYAVLLNPMGLRDGQVGLIAEIGVVLLAWLAVVEIGFTLLSWLPIQPRLRVAIFTLAMLGFISARIDTLWTHSPNGDLRAATRLADQLFADVPPGSLLLASSDQRASSCVWQQTAVGVRPDTRCVPLVFTRDPRMSAWLAETGAGAHFLAAAAQLRTATTRRKRAAALGVWLRPATAAGPVLWERGQAFEDAQVGDHLLPGFPWDRVAPTVDRPATPERLRRALRDAQYACVMAGEGRCRRGPAAASIGSWASLWGAWLLRRRAPEASAFLEAAVRWAPTSAPALNNLAVQRTAIGAYPEALDLCRRALRAQPDYRRAHRTAARAAVRAGADPDALRHSAAWWPKRPSARDRKWLRGLVGEAQRRGDLSLAAKLAALDDPARDPSGAPPATGGDRTTPAPQ